MRVSWPAAPPECAAQLSVLRPIVEELLRADAARACWLVGSFATNRADRYSDIDLEVAGSVALLRPWTEDPLSHLQVAGTVLFHRGGGSDDYARFGAVYQGPVILDVALYNLDAALIPRAGQPLHVLFDRGLGLSEGTGLRPPVVHDPNQHSRQIEDRIAWFWVWALTALRFLGRQDYVWAAGFLSALRATLAQLEWLEANPDAVPDLGLACGWGNVRTDLPLEARRRLGAMLAPEEQALIGPALRRCMAAFSEIARRLAERSGQAYPEALEAEALAYAERVCGGA